MPPRFSSRYATFSDWLASAVTPSIAYTNRIIRLHWKHPDWTLDQLRGHKPKKKPIVGWSKTLISYSCQRPPTHSSWHVDLVKVTGPRTHEAHDGMIKGQEAECWKYLGKAFTKALSENTEVMVHAFALLERYPIYQGLNDFRDIFSMDSTWEEDGEEEELLELWRCKHEM